ncbi:hypothetical protein ACHAWF_015085 [Thalassiosira exigua]
MQHQLHHPSHRPRREEGDDDEGRAERREERRRRRAAPGVVAPASPPEGRPSPARCPARGSAPPRDEDGGRRRPAPGTRPRSQPRPPPPPPLRPDRDRRRAGRDAWPYHWDARAEDPSPRPRGGDGRSRSAGAAEARAAAAARRAEEEEEPAEEARGRGRRLPSSGPEEGPGDRWRLEGTAAAARGEGGRRGEEGEEEDEDDDDARSKKSRGLLSRASAKLKKKLGRGKGKEKEVVAGATEGTASEGGRTREGRDPSPTRLPDEEDAADRFLRPFGERGREGPWEGRWGTFDAPDPFFAGDDEEGSVGGLGGGDDDEGDDVGVEYDEGDDEDDEDDASSRDSTLTTNFAPQLEEDERPATVVDRTPFPDDGPRRSLSNPSSSSWRGQELGLGLGTRVETSRAVPALEATGRRLLLARERGTHAPRERVEAAAAREREEAWRNELEFVVVQSSRGVEGDGRRSAGEGEAAVRIDQISRDADADVSGGADDDAKFLTHDVEAFSPKLTATEFPYSGHSPLRQRRRQRLEQMEDDAKESESQAFAERRKRIQNSIDFGGGVQGKQLTPRRPPWASNKREDSDHEVSTPTALSVVESPSKTQEPWQRQQEQVQENDSFALVAHPKSFAERTLNFGMSQKETSIAHGFTRWKPFNGLERKPSPDWNLSLREGPHATLAEQVKPKADAESWSSFASATDGDATPPELLGKDLQRQNDRKQEAQTHSTKIDELRAENDNLSSELQLMKQRMVNHDKLRHENVELKDENDSLSLDLKRTKKKFTDQEEEMDAASQASLTQIKGLKEVARQNVELKGENDNLSLEVKRLRKKLTEQDEIMESASQATTRKSQELKESSKRSEVLVKENGSLSSDLNQMKIRLIEQESEMELRQKAAEKELRKQERELEALRIQEQKASDTDAAADAKLKAYVTQLSRDMDAYKEECAAYRQRILENEREKAKLELVLYEEQKKVQSLESENKMLLNIAEDNASHASSSNRALQDELAAYKHQNVNYCQRVLDLESKVLSTEGALEATSQAAAALEQEKNVILTQAEQWKMNLTERDAALVESESLLIEKDSELKSLQTKLSALETKLSATEGNIADANVKADENAKTLESENADLLQKLRDANISIERLQTTVADRCVLLENENEKLKQHNNDLAQKDIERTHEVNAAKGLVSNTERLQKMLTENEKYISKLQQDLAQARASHMDTRINHSKEVNSFSDKLREEKEGRHIAETRNEELEDKIVSIKRAYAELEQLGTNQSKSQSDQLMKLMQHADDLRKKHADCQENVTSLDNELSDKSAAHNRIVKELRGSIEVLQKEKANLSNSLGRVKSELLQTAESASREMDDLEQIIKKKDDAFAKLQSKFSEKTLAVESLNETIQQLELELESTTLRRNALDAQVRDMKQHVGAFRIEKTTLLSDVQSRLLDERVTMMKQVKDVVVRYGQRLQASRLEQSMDHSVVMSKLEAEKRDWENLLISEKDASSSLERSLEKAKKDNQAIAGILSSACGLLSVKEKSLVDAIDEKIIALSDSRIHVKTLEVDMAALRTKNANLEYENDQVLNQLEDQANEVRRLGSEIEKLRSQSRMQVEEHVFLEKKLEMTKNEAQSVQDQMKEAFDADRRAQDKAVEEIISAKEESLALQVSLKEEIKSLSKEIADQDERMISLQVAVGESRQERDDSRKECEDITSKYEDCRQQLASLLDKMLTSKNKADDLMAHYMNIEDELRKQLQSVQGEKEGVERKLLIVQRESDQWMDEFYKEKKDLASALSSKEDEIRELEKQMVEMEGNQSKAKIEYTNLLDEISKLKHEFGIEKDNLTSNLALKDDLIGKLERQVDGMRNNENETQIQFHTLSADIAALKQNNSELQKKYDQVCSERADLISNGEKLASTVEKLGGEVRNAVAELESTKQDRVDLEKRYEQARGERDDLTGKSEQLACAISLLEVKLRDAMEELGSAKQGKADLQERYDQLCHERNDLTDKSDKLASAVPALESKLKDALEELGSTKQKLSSMLDTERLAHADTTKALQNEIHRLTVERNLLTEKIQESSTANETMKAACNQLKSKREKEHLVHNNAVIAMQNDIRSKLIERDTMTRRAEDLAERLVILESSEDAKNRTIMELENAVRELREDNTSIRMMRDSLTEEVQRLSSSISAGDEKKEQLESIVDRMVMDRHALNERRAELESFNKSMESTIEAERLVHASELEKLQSEFDSELSICNHKVDALREDAHKLREAEVTLKDQNEDKERQIVELKESLKDALEEALRLGSKVTAEQGRLAELTFSVSSFEEENGQLQQFLQQTQSEFDTVTSRLSSQEGDNWDLKESLLELAEEKKQLLKQSQLLEAELASKEAKLFETVKKLSHYELKLTSAEQERDEESERARAEISRLKNDLCLLETTQHQKEQDLMDQIIASKSQMKEKEAYCNARARDMKNKVDFLKHEIETLTEEKEQLALANEEVIADCKSLNEEKNRLSLANDFMISENNSLAEKLAYLETKLERKETDELSAASEVSRAFQIKRTASELEMTVQAIKKHHSETVKKLQRELEDVRKRLKKSERKAKDLTILLQENSLVIESLHKKLRGKKKQTQTGG